MGATITDARLISALDEAYRRAPKQDPLTVFAEHLAPDCVFEDWVGGVRVQGADAIRTEVYERYLQTYRDCAYEVEASVTDGRQLVVSGMFRGRKVRESGDEIEVQWRFRDLYEVGNGLVRWFSVASDTAAVDAQLEGEAA